MSSFYTGWRIQSCQLTNSSPYSPPPPGSLHSTAAQIYHPAEATSTSQDDNNNQFLQVTWYNPLTHESMMTHYSLAWLEQCRYDPEALEERRRATSVSPALALSSSRPPQAFEFSDFVTHKDNSDNNSDDTLFSLLHAIVQDGAALIHNAPNDDTTVTQLATLLAGGTSHGHLYGDIFHVMTRVNAHNIAYTSEALAPHQDLSYYESQPGLQLLHCIDNNPTTVVGGESTLVDVMAAATELQRLAPDLFDSLTTTEATFIKQRHGADIVYRGPYISVDSSQSVVGVRWSPPFEGPMCAPEHVVADVCLAKSAMEFMVDNAVVSEHHTGLDTDLQQQLRDYAQEYTWEYRLQPGDVLVFNNQRMLHGRRGFRLTEDAEDGDRHLIGCYTNMEETLNQYRLRRRRHLSGDSSLQWHRNTGNNSSAC